MKFQRIHNPEFQSHYGLILTKRPKNRKSLANLFQSHYGLILTVNSSTFLLPRMCGFQSHYGLILTALQLRSLQCFGYISIPLWSDFNIQGFKGRRHRRNEFQSHYGLILTMLSRSVCVFLKKNFNPIMV